MTACTIRAIRSADWKEVRALRLHALQDEAAALAFLDSHADAAARPDSYWIERTVRSSEDAGVAAGARQFVAVAADGEWVGTTTVLIERKGDTDYFDGVVEQDGGHLVGVYIKPEYRAAGLITRLFASCTAWLTGLDLSFVRLYVHEDNHRAQRAYEKCGFIRTGVVQSGPHGNEVEMATSLPTPPVAH
ncbi:GNAT family N-acetyltransferase [Microbacterium sp. YY-01]|uniref:GNAT family N-acetyltransferase n=1 Tax=Microbacterium sp. YY-01 TaxID=3421634 RepID=UPI003D1833E2